MLERFERVDRRFAQNEQRLGRVDQRLSELVDRIEGLRQELIEQLGLRSNEDRLADFREADVTESVEP
jgi:hypothetical protein